MWLKGLATVAALLVLACVPLHAQPASNAQSARAMQLVRFVVPEFPAFMRQAGVLQGTVVAAIGRNLQGVPDDVLVLESSDPRFSDAALEAIREWRFETTAKSGTATEDSVHVVRFLFTSGAVSIVPLTASSGAGSRRGVRADTPVELPNFSHLDAVPQTVRSPNPEFPAALRGRVPEGTVVVKYFVDRTGQVRLPVLISATDPEFGAAAIATMRQWRYEPPLIDGKPVIALERHSFQFRAPNTR